MACAVDNNALEITPSRKRKREYDCKYKIADGLANEGFKSSTSTPNKETKNFLESLTRFSQCKKTIYAEKENYAGMEVKSIFELTAKTSTNKELENCENPYEVIRKPPKKMKKEIGDEEANCFVNSALNLEIPDKKFNPFEVQRLSPPKDPNEPNSNCFVNPGLNIRVEDNFLNPYEITRNKVIGNQQNGIENPALETPRMWTLGIPFAPNIGCRIDFKNIPLENLTPTKLYADRIGFTPTNPRVAALKSQTKETFQRSLSVISEETVDIGRELDCYQLELENSINEAKLKKKTSDDLDCVKEDNDSEAKNFAEISGIDILVYANEPKTPSVELSQSDDTEDVLKGNIPANVEEFKPNISKDKDELIDTKEDKISEQSFEDSFNDDLDFKAPAPFVRAYRKPIIPQFPAEETPKLCETKPKSKSNPVASVIRKSIRKLIHPNSKSEKTVNKSNENLSNNSKNESSNTNHIFESIRHSLRRKPNKKITTSSEQIDEKADDENAINCKDVTLTERQIFRSTTDEFIVEKKISLRSSLRKSTRGMKNHVMKTVFKKNVEEYEFKK